jgi:hypothetical protein
VSKSSLLPEIYVEFIKKSYDFVTNTNPELPNFWSWSGVCPVSGEAGDNQPFESQQFGCPISKFRKHRRTAVNSQWNI